MCRRALLLVALALCLCLLSQTQRCASAGVNNVYRVLEGFEGQTHNQINVRGGSVAPSGMAECALFEVPDGSSALYLDHQYNGVERGVFTDLGEFTGRVRWGFVAQLVNCSSETDATNLVLSYFDTNTAGMVVSPLATTMATTPGYYWLVQDVPVLSTEDGTYVQLAQDASGLAAPTNSSDWVLDVLSVSCTAVAVPQTTAIVIVTITENTTTFLDTVTGGAWLAVAACPSTDTGGDYKLIMNEIGTRLVETIDFDISTGATLSFEFWVRLKESIPVPPSSSSSFSASSAFFLFACLSSSSSLSSCLCFFCFFFFLLLSWCFFFLFCFFCFRKLSYPCGEVQLSLSLSCRLKLISAPTQCVAGCVIRRRSYCSSSPWTAETRGPLCADSTVFL
jgi:hypothetical protein